ncbi:AraC-like DNA-binding protein [Natranaerovirga hydrolytica]|uniref:AraC-like DNA-binding protein n=1 Tax=Natranaerovirga hydrolytica TaxID=680378 RepID=A0A4R1N6R7_9FIRM|nr:helix-turn-helix transcriptional regulator [Natranaerovirga hydrolytica]TCK98729.1 AraC-like DNA-binding protein [Natranaerovirga hydrolytica]
MTYDASSILKPNKNHSKHSFFNFDITSQSYLQNDSELNNVPSLYSLLKLPLDGYPIHCSSSYISMLFVYGNVSVTINDQNIICLAGNIFLIRHQCQFTITSGKNAKVYVAHFKRELFDSLFYSQIVDCPLIYDFFMLDDCKNEFLYFDCTQEMFITHFAQSLQKELQQSDYLADKTVRCAIVLFLSNLHRIHRPNLVISESSMMKKYFIGNILKYMSDNYTTATLSSTAEYFNYNPAYFSTIFQKYAYCSFTQKMLEFKLEHARRLLITTNLTVQEISANIGFKEKSYFYRCFKKNYGVTPGQFRRGISRTKTIL